MLDCIVSFCVPSYNRSDMTAMIVESILEYEGDDIEVVVVDNCSDDDTVARLGLIEDERLSVRVNDANVGGPGNMVESLRLAKGKYAFVALSRDDIDSSRIGDLVSFLRESEFSVVYCCNDGPSFESRSYPKGEPALTALAYRSNHPTGLVFRSDVLGEVLSHMPTLAVQEKMLYFPHEAIIAEALSQGALCVYGERIRIRVSEEYLRKSVSSNVAFEDDAWFFPGGRLKQFEKYCAHLSCLPVDEGVRSRVFNRRFRNLLRDCTYVYRLMREDELTCAHYRVQPRSVSFADLMAIAHSVGLKHAELSKQYGFRSTPMDRVAARCSRLHIGAYLAYKRAIALKGR